MVSHGHGRETCSQTDETQRGERVQTDDYIMGSTGQSKRGFTGRLVAVAGWEEGRKPLERGSGDGVSFLRSACSACSYGLEPQSTQRAEESYSVLDPETRWLCRRYLLCPARFLELQASRQLRDLDLEAVATKETEESKQGTHSQWLEERQRVTRKEHKTTQKWTTVPDHIKSRQSPFSSQPPGGALAPTRERAALKNMAPIRDSVSHSPNQTGLEHPGLDSQYEPSPWSTGSPCGGDGNSNWDAVLVEGSADKPSNLSSTNSSVWPSSSSSSSSSGCGSGSDPELASECMDADSSSPLGSERNLAAVSTTTAAMMSLANASAASSSSSAAAPSSVSTAAASALVNGDGNANRQTSGGAHNGNNNNNPCGPSSHYSMAGVGSNNGVGGGQGNRLVGSSVWGAQPAGNPSDGGGGGGLNPSTLNPLANHGAWPRSPTPNPAPCPGQRPPQAPGAASKSGAAPPHDGWGDMPAQGACGPMDEGPGARGAATGGGSDGQQSPHPHTESNGPNNTMMLNTTTTTTTNATGTSSLPNSTGDGPWGSAPGPAGGPLANGPPTLAPHGETARGPGAFGTPWGAPTHPGDKGPAGPDTVNPQHQAGPPAAHKSYHHAGAPRWEQGPGGSPAPVPSGMPWGSASSPAPGPAGQGPRPWGGGASSSSSSSSTSSGSHNKTTNGEWGAMPPGNNHAADAGVRKASSSNNGWKSLEDDALGVGGGGPPAAPAPGAWGRSGGSEGSGESSGGRSGSDKDGQPRGPNRRRPPPPAAAPPAPPARADVDPRVLSNTGWGQTPVRQNTTWDVNSPASHPPPGPRGEDRKPGGGGSGWAGGQPVAPSQTSSGGWREGPGNSGPDKGGPGWGEPRPNPGWDNNTKGGGSGGHGGRDDASSYKGGSGNTWSNNPSRDDRSNTWTNAPRQPRQQQGWGGGGGGEGWGNGGGGDSSSSSSYRGGSNNHWGDAQKGGGGGGGGGGAWEGDSDRSGSGCWSDPSRANANNGGGGGGNTWTGSSAANTQDQGNHNQGSNSWGDPTGPKPAPQGRGQGWGEPQKHHHGNQSWGEPPPKTSNPSNEWGKGPEPVARGGQGPTKPTGWMGGPIPAGCQREKEEPAATSGSGWEEPSPESIRRRMEIDDGTAAWGEPGRNPGKYNAGGPSNTWNKNSQSEQEPMSHGPPPGHQLHQSQGPIHAPQPMQTQAPEKTSSA
ncbi:unnamed protein product, partial [Gadus morhua 'NCC']